MKGIFVATLGLSIALLGSVTPEAIAQTTSDPLNQSVGTGMYLNYPSGTRIYRNGTIIAPQGDTLVPNNRIRHADGSTSFYYPNGTIVRTRDTTISPSGTFLSPGTNGGLRNSTSTLQRSRFTLIH
ncbi:MAG TPA: hypothetical protein V6C78_25380 [Crinalium sp.]